MNCQEFQEALPYIIESGGNEEEAGHLHSCPACANLVQELNYIADTAKLLLPMHDPNPRVWSNIEQSLYREGLLTGYAGRWTERAGLGIRSRCRRIWRRSRRLPGRRLPGRR